MTPTGGSLGNPHPAARTHCHAWRRGGGVAARGARAADGDTGDRVPRQHVASGVGALSDGIPTGACYLGLVPEHPRPTCVALSSTTRTALSSTTFWPDPDALPCVHAGNSKRDMAMRSLQPNACPIRAIVSNLGMLRATAYRYISKIYQ
jgi:hypothetical protein